VLSKVVRHWGRLARDGNPEAYIRKSLVNQYTSWRRRSRPEQPSAAPTDHGASHDDATLDRIVLRQALARLGPRQRAVIVLRFCEDLTEAQTAEALGCSVGIVKSQTHHALNRGGGHRRGHDGALAGGHAARRAGRGPRRAR
jgi:RNA polymerase sigma factor (sigma-70 family)